MSRKYHAILSNKAFATYCIYSLIKDNSNFYSTDLPEELFAAYRESYITKDAAKKFSKKIRAHKKPFDDKDYEDLLQEIVVIPSEKIGNKMYEKRYFDYQPAERSDVEISYEEVDIPEDIESQQEIFVESLKNQKKRNARTNSRRLRRNAGKIIFFLSLN